MVAAFRFTTSHFKESAFSHFSAQMISSKFDIFLFLSGGSPSSPADDDRLMAVAL